MLTIWYKASTLIEKIKVEIECIDNDYQNHYRFTPYSFEPSVSKKLVANPHIDMGQGLLECVREVYKKQNEK